MAQSVTSGEEAETPDIRFDNLDLQPPVTQHSQTVVKHIRPNKIRNIRGRDGKGEKGLYVLDNCGFCYFG